MTQKSTRTPASGDSLHRSLLKPRLPDDALLFGATWEPAWPSRRARSRNLSRGRPLWTASLRRSRELQVIRAGVLQHESAGGAGGAADVGGLQRGDVVRHLPERVAVRIERDGDEFRQQRERGGRADVLVHGGGQEQRGE